jgi:hypothetical protein
MLSWLLAWLFPLWVLLPKARAIGAVSFTEVEGVGWQCTIRPPQTGPWQRGAVNSWSGVGGSLAVALRRALREVASNPKVALGGGKCAPVLGGPEVDPEDGY